MVEFSFARKPFTTQVQSKLSVDTFRIHFQLGDPLFPTGSETFPHGRQLVEDVLVRLTICFQIIFRFLESFCKQEIYTQPNDQSEWPEKRRQNREQRTKQEFMITQQRTMLEGCYDKENP